MSTQPVPHVETRLEAPKSFAEGKSFYDEAHQALREIDAALSAHNSSKPPESQTRNMGKWRAKRSRLIYSKDRAVAAQRFYKQWLYTAEKKRGIGDQAQHLFEIAKTMNLLQRLYVAVGEYLENDSEDNYALLQELYDQISDSPDEPRE